MFWHVGTPSVSDWSAVTQAMDAVHTSSALPAPQQGDPFASSYMHPSGQNSHSHGQDPFGQQPPAQPSYSQPAYAQPSFGQPQSEQSLYGQPSFGQPSNSQPPFGQAPNGQPSFGQPHVAHPSAGQASNGQMPFGQPSYGQAPQSQQQQQPRQAPPGASHNPFAAGGGFGESSVGSTGPYHTHLTALGTPGCDNIGHVTRHCFWLCCKRGSSGILMCEIAAVTPWHAFLKFQGPCIADAYGSQCSPCTGRAIPAPAIVLLQCL